MNRTEKFLRLKTRKGKYLNVVREHYTRDDIPCHSERCSECDQGTGSLLTSDVTHYIVPDTEVAKAYLEIFELPEVQGVLFFQTVVNHIHHHGGRKLQSRLKKLTVDNRQQCTIFSNEFCKGAYVQREAGEPVEKWQQRCIYNGALWYYNHLGQTVPIVVLTDDEEMVKRYGNLTVGLFVMDTGDYLHTFWPDSASVHELYNSLREVLQESKAKGGDGVVKEYMEYLPLEVLEAGIKSGRYLRGCLNVNKHNAQNEAFVQKSSAGLSSAKESLDSDILIDGMTHRNRAIHGDIVVVEVLPKSEWKGKTVALKSHEGGDQRSEEEEERSDVLPTARVVGILQRNWRDYVACFVEDEESQGQRKGGQKVVVIPWDYRIPKIRINSHQVDSLRNHRIIVRIDFWEESSLYPSGHFVRSLGPIGNLETETAALMVENSLFAPPFTEAISKELPSDSPDCPWIMSEEEVQQRRDLRKTHLVFSIDPKGCEDVDDTLSVRLLKRGRIELGVHIADVSHFVKPGSLTDSEARARSTTVYLADRRYDMLPEVLSANLCSLIGGVDKYGNQQDREILRWS